ncbi:MAG: ice-binding family protein [Candidatus Dormibacteraeota bacterium]|nr:ice-binding family protein [Candidatus Dormibacteraeota bacterium]
MGKSARPFVSLLVALAALVAAAWPGTALAATVTQPRLGTALNFAALGGSTITNTGPTAITGNLGLAPGSAVTGFPPGNVAGAQHVADAVALQAKNDLVTAYTDAVNAPTTSNLTGTNLGGRNLVPGVYSFSSSAPLTGSLTLRGNGIYIFKIGSTLVTASNSVVNLTGGAQACAVYWQVGSSATLGSGSHLVGNLMALTSITMVTNAQIVQGRAMARNGALTLDGNHITAPTGTCTVPALSTTRTSVTPTVPGTGTGLVNPGRIALGVVAIFAGGLALAVGRRRTETSS